MNNYALAVLILYSVVSLAQNSGSVAVVKPATALDNVLTANDKAMAQAYKQKDVDFFKRTYTDDFVGIGYDGKRYDKGDVLENIRTGDVQEYRAYNIEILPMGDGAATVTYDCIIRMTLYDEPIPRYQHISAMWVKQGDQWRLKFQQSTPVQ